MTGIAALRQRRKNMRYEIKGTPFPVVECALQANEKMFTESGSMVWMTPNVNYPTHSE